MKKIFLVTCVENLPSRGIIFYVSAYNYLLIKRFLNLGSVVVTFDGISGVFLWRLINGSKVNRLAPDFDSYLEGFIGLRRVHLIGGKPYEVEQFAERYGNSLRIVSYIDGYREDSEIKEHLLKYLEAGDVVLVGRGSPRQEITCLDLFDHYPDALYISCGAFISQYFESKLYYPKFISIFHLRWFYRIVYENSFKRLPLFFYGFLIMCYDMVKGTFSSTYDNRD